MSLQRKGEATPPYFAERLEPADAVSPHRFADEAEQANWVAKSISEDLSSGELEADDILVVMPNPYTTKSSANVVTRSLEQLGIASHLAGVTSSQDELFVRDSVAIANIFRSKGNEAPMVYVLNSQWCHSGVELRRLRNTLFTAITRSRAWVRICGWGDRMDGLVSEIEKVVQNEYRLIFDVPTPPELERMRTIHRDRSEDELSRIDQSVEGLRDLLDLLQRGEIEIESLPPDVRTGLARLIADGGGDDVG